MITARKYLILQALKILTSIPLSSDLREVVKAQLLYDILSPLIYQRQREKLDKITYFILKNSDSLKESIKILKAVKLDAKSQYQKYLKKTRSQHNINFLSQFLIKNLVANIDDLKQKKESAERQYTRIISEKRDQIIRSISNNSSKNMDAGRLEWLKYIQKFKLLDDILNKRYTEKQKLALYLNHDRTRLQAFRELNNDEIIHGFEFVSKSTQSAFRQAVNTNPQFFESSDVPRQ